VAEPLSGERRTCSRCRRSLPVEAFNRMGEGRQFYCRDCFRSYFRARGEIHRQQVRARRPERQRRVHEFMAALLGAASCADCGTSDILVLEFDHVGEKRMAVASLIRSGASRRQLLDEIARCEVVCANCHRRRTADRAGWFRATGRTPATWSARHMRNQSYVLEVLHEAACVDCDERDPVVLEFDHPDGKRANVSTMTDWASLATLEHEIAKCDVRCVNSIGAGPRSRSGAIERRL
jgi:hypothetical protein